MSALLSMPTLPVSAWQAENDALALRGGELPVEFSGEEALGRFLDVHEHYNRFINSKFGRQLDYAGYLAALDAFEDVPRHLRASKPYRWAAASCQDMWRSPATGRVARQPQGCASVLPPGLCPIITTKGNML